MSTLIAGVGLNITFMSYGRQMVFGYTAGGSACGSSMARYTIEAFAALEERLRSAARLTLLPDECPDPVRRRPT